MSSGNESALVFWKWGIGVAAGIHALVRMFSFAGAWVAPAAHFLEIAGLLSFIALVFFLIGFAVKSVKLRKH